jgi:hypothetical protein
MGAAVCQLRGRNALVPDFDCSRYPPTTDTMPSLTSIYDFLLMRRSTFFYIYIYKNVLSVCARVPLCPQISESASPMALEFGHNVAGEYASG